MSPEDNMSPTATKKSSKPETTKPAKAKKREPFGLRLTEELETRVAAADEEVQRRSGVEVSRTGVILMLLTRGLDAFESEAKAQKSTRGKKN